MKEAGEFSLKFVSPDPMSKFSICSGAPPLPAPSPVASWILISVYKAQDLSGEEESQ